MKLKKHSRKLFCIIIAMAMLLTSVPTFALNTDEVVAPGQTAQNSGLAFLEGLLQDFDSAPEILYPSEDIGVTLSNDPKPVDWTVCIYLCGTDLENNLDGATRDLVEMLRADIPENVRLLVLTGGTKNWNPSHIPEQLVARGVLAEGAYTQPSNDETQLWEINDDKMTLIKGYGENKNFGDPQTAVDFLADCRKIAPSERTLVTFWNHGSGPLYGVALDEYTDDILSLFELKTILASQKAATGQNLDLLGFDACFMNNIETAYILAPYADYMVASEASEPGSGWNYSWLNALNKEYNDGDGISTMEADDVGRTIIDKYAYSINKEGDWSQTKDETMALIDLSQMGTLKTAFNEMAYELCSIASDDEKFAKVSRTAEKVQHMTESIGLLDLYDFANDILEYVPSAQGVLDALGTPPGSTPDDYVGEVSGSDPVVVYRGTGLTNNECIGMAFYYPTIKTTAGVRDSAAAKKTIALYRDFGLSDFYTSYLMNVIVNSNKLRAFTGKLLINYDDTLEHYILQVEDPDDARSLKSVRYQNIFTYMPNSEEKTDYLLGTSLVSEDWEKATFTDQFEGEWYTINGELFSMDSTPLDDEWEYFSIPVIVGDDSVISTMKAYHLLPTDSDPDLYVYIGSITTPASNTEGDSSVASRTWTPEGDFTFKTVLQKYDMKTNSILADYHENKPVTVSPNEKDGMYYIHDYLSLLPLSSGPSALYTGYFAVTDMRNVTTLSDPCQYVLLEDFEKDLSVEEIPTQIYTGKPCEPKIRLLFLGEELLQETVDYTVEYANNVEKGWADVTITSLMADFPGVIKLQFQIQDSYGLAEDKIEALLDHLPGQACSDDDEYLSHLYFADQAKQFYEQLSQEDRNRVSAAAKAKLEKQYAATLKCYELTAKDGDIEVFGVLNNLDWNTYFSSLKQAEGSAPITSFDQAWLYAKSAEPASETEKQALSLAAVQAQTINSKVSQKACYYTKFLAKNGNAEPDRVEVNKANGNKVLMKIKLASNIKPETLQIYQIVYGQPTPQAITASVIEEASSNYAIFETDSFGYLALFAETKTASGNGGGGGSSAATVDYKVTFDTQGGSSMDSVTVSKNSTLAKPQSPAKAGYNFDGWFTDKGCTKAYDFSTKVTSGFTLYAKWTAISGSEGGEASDTWNNPFTDVKSSDWFYGNVKYSFENKLFSGISDTLFEPDKPLTRAMLVTALYRAAGEPAVEAIPDGEGFKDVSASIWYANSVYWAKANNIVNGYSDEEFAPDRLISRQEIATILMRYAAFKKIATVGSDDLSGFIDTVSISDWAKDSMQWAVGSKIIGGKADNILDPLSSATRAESAAMLQRLLEK